MTRISSLFVATTLTLLPLSAFAQQNAAPVKTPVPTSMTTAAPASTAPMVDKTVAAKVPAVTDPATASANVTQPAKSDAKVPATGKKSEVHGRNTVAPHHAKVNAGAKTAEPAKS